MSKAGRWGLVALALVVVVAAFLIARPGDEDDDGASDAPVATETSPTATAPSAPKPPADASPAVSVITLKGHEAVAVPDLKFQKGDLVRFVVRSDEPDDIHVHGYDIERSVEPGKPARFSFPATIEGIFEIESHEAEHVGKDALIATLTVEPS